MPFQIEFHDVCFTCKNKQILKDISIDIEAGDFISIVGPSGSGKSTLLKLCCNLISPSSGKILIGGRDIMLTDPVKLRDKIRYCFQTPVLFGNTVMENLAFPYTVKNEGFDSAKAEKLFSFFCLDKSILKADIKKLSGGEKQRIALIRAIMLTPEVLLLDEVTSALDVENTRTVEKAIDTLNKSGVTILWVTHNPAQSRRRAGKIVLIEDGCIKSTEVIK